MSAYNTFVSGNSNTDNANSDDTNNNHGHTSNTTEATATGIVTSSSSPLLPNELRHRRRRSASHTTSSLGSDSERSHSNDHSSPAPHLYSTPFASRALVSAFGLPTLVEYEPPSAVVAAEEAPSSSLPSLRDSCASDAFEPVSRPPSRRSHVRSRSLSAEQQQQQQQQRHSAASSYSSGGRLTRSAYAGPAVHRTRSHDDADDDGHHLHHLYTYRVRTYDKKDDHHILMCQNPDGTYSHVNPSDDDADVATVRDSTLSATGLGSGLFRRGFFAREGAGDAEGLSLSDLKASVISLDAIAQLDDTLAHELHDAPSSAHSAHHGPHHPSVPPEVLHPHYTHTAPPLTLWPLAVLVFYNVSGGPFGIEPSIRSAGNFYSILGFLLFPLVWSLPEAAVTAELGAAFRDPSAGVAWVEESFGETWGAVCGYLNWVSGATDNAIYPTLFLEYVTSVAGWEVTGWDRFACVAAITVALALVNYSGLEIVGNASLVVCIIAMSPFVILTLVGAPKVVPSRWFQMPEDHPGGGDADEPPLFDDDFQTAPGPLPLFAYANILWRPFLNNMFWNLNSFDAAASFAGETSCVSTTYPRGIYLGLVMCVAFYILPLLVAVGATDYTQEEWVDGHLGKVAVDIGGKWLGGWTVFAAGISNLALFEAEMSADAFRLMGMAERGYLPKIFQKRSKRGAPTTGIITGTIVILIFGCADFGTLLELLNANYALALLMEYAAFIKLRLYRKDLPRPYRIPVPDWMAVLIALPPTLGILAIFLTSNWFVYFFCTGAILIGFGLYKFGEVSKRKGWFDYNETARERFGRDGMGGGSHYAMSPVQLVEDGVVVGSMATKADTMSASPPLNGSALDEGGNEKDNDNLQSLGDRDTGEWDYKNEELDVIQEENKIV